jgi:hypothetical protein
VADEVERLASVELRCAAAAKPAGSVIRAMGSSKAKEDRHA